MTGLLLSLTLMLLPQAARPLDDAEVKRLVDRSEVVVVAKVEEVEPTSAGQPWSGLISSNQYVQYSVREVLKGELPDGKIRVSFILVRNGLTADESQPRLSFELFQKNNVHILFLKRDSPSTDKKQLPWLSWLSYKSIDEDYGAIMATPDVGAKIRALASTTPNTQG